MNWRLLSISIIKKKKEFRHRHFPMICLIWLSCLEDQCERWYKSELW